MSCVNSCVGLLLVDLMNLLLGYIGKTTKFICLSIICMDIYYRLVCICVICGLQHDGQMVSIDMANILLSSEIFVNFASEVTIMEI